MNEPPRRPPQRLVEVDDLVGRALRDGTDAPSPNDEVRAWMALEERLNTRHRWASRGLFGAVTVVVALGLITMRSVRAPAPLSLAPEPIAAVDNVPNPSRVEASKEPRPGSIEFSPTTIPQAITRTPPSRPLVPPAETAEVLKAAELPGPKTLAIADCKALGRERNNNAAAQCYARIAKGGSQQSQIALVELARLRRGPLGDAPGAIAALREYKQRFPGGNLRSEVQLALVDLLAKTGRSVEAEREAKIALLAGVAPERTGDLHLLIAAQRANVGDCGAARARLEDARRAGANLAKIRVLERRCDAVSDPSGLSANGGASPLR